MSGAACFHWRERSVFLCVLDSYASVQHTHTHTPRLSAATHRDQVVALLILFPAVSLCFHVDSCCVLFVVELLCLEENDSNSSNPEDSLVQFTCLIHSSDSLPRQTPVTLFLCCTLKNRFHAAASSSWEFIEYLIIFKTYIHYIY